MGSFNYWETLVRMGTRADKFDLRLRLVQHALRHGVKPAARVFGATPKTVRKWLSRYRQERLAGLNELPRIPLTGAPGESGTVVGVCHSEPPSGGEESAVAISHSEILRCAQNDKHDGLATNIRRAPSDLPPQDPAGRRTAHRPTAPALSLHGGQTPEVHLQPGAQPSGDRTHPAAARSCP